MKLNKDIAVKNIILLGFAYFMINIYHTGQITKYVHPRMNIYILLCGIYFTVLAVINFKSLFIEYNHKVNKAVLVIFTIPLCIALFIPPASLSADVIKNKGTNISQMVNNTSEANNSSSNANTDNSGSQFTSNNYGTDSSTPSDNSINSTLNIPINVEENKESQLKFDKGIIKITSDNYYMAVSELFNNTDDYQGKGIEISGYIFRDKDFKPNQFVIGRTLITCCTADASIFGVMGEMKGADQLKDDDWYTITGKIKTITDQGEKIPGVEVISMKKISKPENDYVYP